MTTVYVGDTPYNFPDSMSPDDIHSAMQNIAIDPNTGQMAQGPAGNPLKDFTYGLGKPFDTAATLLDRGVAAITPQGSAVQQWAQNDQADIAKRAQAYRDYYGGNPPANSPQRDLGEALPMAAASMALPGANAGFLPRLASNAVGGALSGVLTGNPNASPSQLGSEALQGGGLGAAAAPLTGIAARTAYPAMAQNPASDVSRLMDIGVRPTPGQMMGGAANRIEQGLTSLPLVGDLIKNARQRSVYQFNMGLMNDALAPIGETLDATRPGRGAVEEMANKISNAYQRAVPQAGGTLDQQATQDLQQLRTNSAMLGPGRSQQFNAMLDQYVQRHIDPTTGVMTGQGFKDADSDLGKEAAGYLYNPQSTSDERQLGTQLRNTQSVLRDWLQRTNPQVAGDLQAANAAYARQLRVENAAARPGAEPGVFSPAQFQAAVKAYAPQGQVARGQALSQDLSDAGRAVLGPTMPDSGTPFRSALMLAGGALGGHGMGLDLPLSAKLGALGAAGGAAAAYNPVSQNIIATMMASRYPWMQNVATGARGLSPILAGAAPAGLLSSAAPSGLLAPP